MQEMSDAQTQLYRCLDWVVDQVNNEKTIMTMHDGGWDLLRNGVFEEKRSHSTLANSGNERLTGLAL